MNTLKLVVAAGFIATSIGVASVVTTPASAAGDCTVKPVGTENTANQKDSKFTKKGNKVTGKFKVSGKNCREKVTVASWESPNNTHRPLSAQRLHDSATGTFKEGVHTLTVEVATDKDRKVPGCNFQVDMVKGGQADADPSTPGAEHYGNERLLGFVVGGNEKCQEEKVEKIKVCDLETKKIVKIKESEFDASKHSRNLDDCKTNVENVLVCDEDTGEIIEVTPAEKENYLPIDDAACEDEPGKGGEETPEEIASTGPLSAVVSFAGVSTLAGSLQYYIQSRRRLM